MDYGRGECTLSDHRPVRGVFEIRVVIIDHHLRNALKTQLYQSKNKTATKPALPARPKPLANVSKSVEAPLDPVLIDLSEKVELDLKVSHGMSRNPFVQETETLDSWKPLQPVQANAQKGSRDFNSLNPFI